MGAKGSMAGWIGFAGIVMFIIGGLNMFQGLVAIFDDEYFVPTEAGFLLVDLTAWGWTMLIWGALSRPGSGGHAGSRSWSSRSTSSPSSAFSETATTRTGP